MKRTPFIVIALMSISIIALELIWTRIFSAEFYYTFAFLVLSLAVFGLGLGALAVRLFKKIDQDKFLGVFLSLTGLMSFLGPILVFQLGMDLSKLFTSFPMIIRFAAAILLLSSAFFYGGIALAMIFKRYHAEIPRLYMYDLVGAGIGVAFAICIMNWFSTPVAAFLCALPVLAAALFTSDKWMKIIPVALAVAVFALCPFADSLLQRDREERAPVMYKHWDAMSLVKLFEHDGPFRGMNIDNVAHSSTYEFDGNWDRPDSMRFQFGIEVGYLIRQFDSCTFLSLGAGGGVDVLQALQEGATEIHAVEVNSHVNELMLSGELADFSGNIYHDPRVIVATDDARAYVKRYKNKFDLIYSLSSNTFAAVASGSFALAENYLFTTEAFRDYWEAMSDSGFMMMEHQFYMPRLVAEVMDALNSMGIEDIGAHLAVYDLPQLRRNIMLLSKRPLTDEIRYNAFFELTEENYEYIHLLYPAPDSLADNLINRIILNGWQDIADTAAIDISPCTDNRPFTAQMGLFRNLSWDKFDKVTPLEFTGFPLAKVIMIIIILVAIALIIPLNLLPYIISKEKLKAVPFLYFFFIGMAYMIIEVVLMQKYTLLVGPSVYSISTILLTLLVASGIGSRFARHFNDTSAFIGILLWLILDALLFTYFVDWFGVYGMTTRILVTAFIIFPLGFFMGMPFPKGTLRVGSLVDWGFAINGVAAVLGATYIILIASSFGFIVALMYSGLLYLIAMLLMSWKRAW